ncbi:uncharacterized protein BDW43DRAFT_314128 [Aspergillus alliaceus]|uniref:uncharacterized protein n=1 Tax=Petromyces alliaceus TaxID=209559 RepID=UPI0012A7743B|nr:uncharacterized protein BDW43DRAFT_314128 [Aspergillus alliaceus]KAB8230255.1 hypothetical protein BDW43DRAFT_314128 [Aspergillus alliaceus]
MGSKAERTQECLAEMHDHFRNTKSPADLLILIGRVGTGKSSLMEDLTGLNGYSQQSVNSVTQEAEIAKAVIEGREYFIMDTPGFDAENENTYFEIIRGIQSIRHVSRITGLLYLTCINQSRFEDIDRNLIRFIYALCGEDYIPRLGALQREWEQGVRTQHLSLYQHGREYNANGLDMGRIINWFANRDQVSRHAKEMIHRNYRHTASEFHPPRIVRELDANIPTSETEAGRLLGLSSTSASESTSRGQPREQQEQQRRTLTPSEAPRNSRQEPRAPQEPPSSGFYILANGLARLIGNVLGGATVDVNIGGPGPGRPPFMGNVPTGPFDQNSSVDWLKRYNLDPSREGRLRYAATHGIGGEPFSADWGDAIRRDVMRRYG